MNCILYEDHNWLLNPVEERRWLVRWFRNTRGEVLYFTWWDERTGL